MASYIYFCEPILPSGFRRLHWDTTTHGAYENTLGAGAPLSYPDNTIVDVYQKSSNRVAIVMYNSSNNGLVTPYYSYPRLFVNETILSGTGGDINNILLYKKCNTLLSPPTFEFAIFSTTTKEVTTFIYPLSQAPFCSPFTIGETVLNQTCIGTTLRRVTYNGDYEIIIEDTPNSTICGYVAPVPDVVITEVKRIKIDQACYDNAAYLVWKNTLGGWDQWLFKKTQTKNLLTEDLGNFVQPEYSLEDSTGASNSLGANVGNGLILGANGLTTNQYEAIRELIYAPVVYWLQLDSSQILGYTLTKVKARSGTWAIETKDDFHNIEFELTLPDSNTVKS